MNKGLTENAGNNALAALSRYRAPNQVLTWDIAKLATRRLGEYLSLFVVMDLFRRHIVAWMLSR